MGSIAPSNKYTRLFKSLTSSQKMAATSPDNVVVRAAAGSGKTTVLVARFIESFKAELERENERSIADVLASIAAITFTEKAASEMKGRIRSLLIDGLKTGPARGQHAGAWRQAQDAMGQCNIGTIHSFCASVLRRFPLEAGLDPEFGILDETESFLMRREAVESLFSGHGEVGSRKKPMSLFAVYPRQKAVQLLLPLLESIETLLGHLTPYAEVPVDALAREIQERSSHTGLELGPEKDNAGIYEPLLEAARLKVLAQGALLAHSVYTARKQALSLLDFADLQTTLLRILSNPQGAILGRLKEEFTTIMIDEFQDTDRFQWELARTLSSTADNVIKRGKLFVVGDERQSIYGFRGADLKAFRETTAEIEGCAGARVEMQENFRSLPNIIGFINLIFTGDGESQRLSSVPMVARRTPDPDSHTGTVELLFPRPEGVKKDNVRAEAELLARRIAAMAEPNNPMRKDVFDQAASALRPCRYDDIALLIRARTHLGTYQDALRRDGIPFSIAGGLGFYERQEIKDIYCLLEVVSDPKNDVALAGLLRSPFFAVSDEGLFWLSSTSRAARRDVRLWDKLVALAERGAKSVAPWDEPGLDPYDEESLRLAHGLIHGAALLAPGIGAAAVIRLLLRRTGALAAYSAQPDGAQCVANLEKIDAVLNTWDRTGHRSLGAVIRLLERLSTEEVREAEAQPDLEAGEGVKIMTIHAAKGLEFPIVLVVDVFAEPYWGSSDQVYIDRELGLGLRVPDASVWGKQVNTRLRDAIKPRLKEAASDQQKRLWYVACTRARDHLLLSGTIALRPSDALGSRALRLLEVTPDSVASEATGVEVQGLDRPISLFTSREQISHESVSRSDPRGLMGRLHTAALEPAPLDPQGAAQPQLRYLPACVPARFEPQVSPSDLDVYCACPRRYLLDRVLSPALSIDRPRAARDSELEEAHGAEFGTLVHEVLMRLDFADYAQDERLLASLTKASDRSASDVLRNLLLTFRGSPLCEALRAARRVRREVPFVLRREAGVLRGRIDLLYEDKSGRICVVDYKTDRDSTGIAERYEAQMTAYGFTVASLHALPPEAISVSIYLARTGELVPVSMDADAFARVMSLMDGLCAALESASHRAYFECFGERPEACDDCYTATKRACTAFKRSLATV